MEDSQTKAEQEPPAGPSVQELNQRIIKFMRTALGNEDAEGIAAAAQQLACDVYNEQADPESDGPDALVGLFTALACYSVVAIEHISEANGMKTEMLRMLLTAVFDEEGEFREPGP
ncbi:hypothetical protein ACFP1Z_11810 [Streptomyces gamaensis]|uniref:Uncharacterized protein n=1 Tax=Streptomyces gamaensis TaxID=1763542 RepID=A0ABW0YXD4_9ACTN